MEAVRRKLREQKWFETVYKIAVGIKGFDGLVELLAGIGLAVSPATVHVFLSFIVGHANTYHNGDFRFLAEYVAGVDAELTRSGIVFLAIFLISHGVIKLALVYCLLREILKAYPFALGLLVLFLVIQIGAFVMNPGLGMAALIVLDAIIVWLVWGEYRELKDKAAKRPSPVSAK